MIQTVIFDPNYYKIGDTIGVPNVNSQNKAYKLAADTFKSKRIDVYNVYKNSKLLYFPKISPEEFYKKLQ